MERRAVDVLIVSLGSTGGLRVVDDELLASLRRAGAIAEIVRPDPPRPVRTMMLTDLSWALATRRAVQAELRRVDPRALIYSTTTAALLWSRPGAIRFDAPAAGNRPGRHGLWQRPLERRRLRQAPLLLPQSAGALSELGGTRAHAHALVLPVPVEPSAAQVCGDALPGQVCDDALPDDFPSLATVAGQRQTAAPVRDIAAITYAANPAKKGLDLILKAWQEARRKDEQLVVVGVVEQELRGLGYAVPAQGVTVLPVIPGDRYRALLRRARVFVCAARREDYGIAQLEALADGCVLVTRPSPGPYVALSIARELDGRLVGDDLAASMRTALDDPTPNYAERALQALAPVRRAEVDRLVANHLLPRLLRSG